MVKLQIGTAAYTLPTGWHEVRLNDFIKLASYDDWYSQLIGIDIEEALTLLDIADANKVVKAMKFTSAPLPTIAQPCDVEGVPFGTFVQAMEFLKVDDHAAAMQCYYPSAGADMASGYACYVEFNNAFQSYAAKWRAFDNWRWPSDNSTPSDGKRLDAFGYYGVVVEIAGNITREDQVMGLAARHVYNHYAYNITKRHISANLQTPSIKP